MSKTALLVGGPKHGKQYTVPNGERYIKVAVQEPVNLFASEYDPLSPVPYKTGLYTEEYIDFFGHYARVFFWQELYDNGTTARKQERVHLLTQLIFNDTGKLLLSEA